MRQQILECVPNFSEGRDRSIIKQITDAIESVEGVKLLDVDPGQATNRTVVTFVGAPGDVVEAAVRAGRKASEVIDMRRHLGEHPRFGAMDVCPLVPVANLTLDETVPYAHRLAARLGEEVGLTVFCYEHAARSPQRRNLADVRAGEYEGLADRLARPEWKPDFGPAEFNPRSGATAVGARDFLVAYNINLNTTSTRRANAVAFDVREKGRKKRRGNPISGPVVLDQDGHAVWIPGSLRCVKAIGWFIEEYGIAQISMNLTCLDVTPLHAAFDEVCRKARARGLRVTGSELVGLVPLKTMLDAGRYFLRKQQRSLGVSDSELIKIAVKSLGLDDLAPFRPEEKIIEYAMEDPGRRRLVDLSVKAFFYKTASEAPAPGGGSVAAAVGAMGAALATMVANLSSHKRGWDDRWEEFSMQAERGMHLHDRLLRLVDEDTEAFHAVMAARRLPAGSEGEKQARERAMVQAIRTAIQVPFQIMETAWHSMEIIRAMAETGMPGSVSDAGVAALCARTAVRAAFLNVKINAATLNDRTFVAEVLSRGTDMEREAAQREQEILETVERRQALLSGRSSGGEHGAG
ncbi:MAG: glutamate formimidoyltransferase [Acidobacteriota bacterium]